MTSLRQQIVYHFIFSGKTQAVIAFVSYGQLKLISILILFVTNGALMVSITAVSFGNQCDRFCYGLFLHKLEAQHSSLEC